MRRVKINRLLNSSHNGPDDSRRGFVSIRQVRLGHNKALIVFMVISLLGLTLACGWNISESKPAERGAAEQ
jgi:hypothetical protein